MGIINREKINTYQTGAKSRVANVLIKYIDSFVVANEINALKNLFQFFEINDENIIQIEDALFPFLMNYVSNDKNLKFIELILKKIPRVINRQDSHGTTLLAMAAGYGSHAVVNFLLKKGADPSILDEAGQTALSRAVSLQQVDTIPLLLQAFPDALNIREKSGFTPLHAAIFTKNPAIKVLLKNATAKFIPITIDGVRYAKERDFINLCERNVAPSIELPDLTIKLKASLAKGCVYFLKAILDGNKENYFNDAINYFKSFVSQASTDNSDEMEQVFQALYLLTTIYDIYKFEGNNNLVEFISEQNERLNDIHNKIFLYTVLSAEKLVLSQNNDAELYARMALSIAENQAELESELRHNIYFNLASAITDSKPQEALHWFDKALSVETFESDEITIAHKVKILAKLNKINEARLETERFQNDDTKNLMNISLSLVNNNSNQISEILAQYNWSQFNEQWLISANSLQRRLFSQINSELAWQSRNYEAAISLSIEGLAFCDEGLLAENLSKILQMYRVANLWEQGLDFLHKINIDYPLIMQGNYSLLKYQEFMLYEHLHQFSEADRCARELLDSNGPEQNKSVFIYNTHCLRLLRAKETRNLELANDVVSNMPVSQQAKQTVITYIENSLHDNDTSGDTQEIFAETLESSDIDSSNVTDDLSSHSDSAEAILQVPDTQRAVRDFEIMHPDIAHDSFVDEMEQSFADPRAIHAFFQKEKAKQQYLMHEEIVGTKPNKPLWLNAQGEPFNLQECITYKINDSFYAVIDTKISERLETHELLQFQQALSKGLVKKREGANGVKIVKNKCIELKINSDKRLVANTLFTNAKGECLIVFDAIMNHPEISRLPDTAESNKTLKAAISWGLFGAKYRASSVISDDASLDVSSSSPRSEASLRSNR